MSKAFDRWKAANKAASDDWSEIEVPEGYQGIVQMWKKTVPVATGGSRDYLVYLLEDGNYGWQVGTGDDWADTSDDRIKYTLEEAKAEMDAEARHFQEMSQLDYDGGWRR